MFDSNSTIDIRPNKLQAKKLNSFSSGFTLMEVMVSVTIFAFAITLMMSLFNYTLKIYRRVEAQRQVSQAVRTTMEFIVKEVRNGRVDYGISNGLTIDTPIDPTNCPAPASLSANTYSTSAATVGHLALVNVEGERECIYWQHDPDPTQQDAANNNNLWLKKEGAAAAAQLNAPNVKLKDLRFYVKPLHDPYTDSPSLSEKEPSVTIVAQVSVLLSTGERRTVPYQTSVSTYIYDIPSQ